MLDADGTDELGSKAMRDDISTRAAYGRARRHSATVAVLKRALPVTAVAVIGGFAAATIASGAFDAAAPVKTAAVAQGEVVMANPRLDGIDRNQRPYALTANAARQEVGEPAVVALDAIDASLPTGEDEFASVDAAAGLYDTKNETLTLSEGVVVRDLKGLDMNLEQARFDLGAGTMESDAPVAVRSRNADIDAQSMKVLESGKRILFSKRVRMVIHNGSAQPTDQSTTQPTARPTSQPVETPANDKAALLGPAAYSTAPWVHSGKVSIARFAVPGEAAETTLIRGTN